MKRKLASKLSLDLETIKQLDTVVGGNGPAGVRTSCVPACTNGPQGPQGPTKTLTGGPQSSPIHTCLPSRANCLP